MFRNQYDTDVTTWSPQGRIHQVEYAMEAVKQGSACVGVKSKTHAVLTALKRSTNDMSSYQKKIFKVDEHMGIAISGLTADARSLCMYMRTECLQHKYVYESPVPVQRLVIDIADKCQGCTQSASARPYGVGLLVAGMDQTGPHVYYNCPSGNYYEYKAMTIGARSQAAKTYLEKHFASFENLELKDLVKHALTALKETSQNGDINAKNASVAIVGMKLNPPIF
uniref:Proteasome subunit alpha type n=1 Tax=Guillardia theta TaxID=55529 RepID=A0A7S4PAC0_GUITH